METLINIVGFAAMMMYFIEREKSKRLEAQVSTLVKLRDLNAMDKSMEPLKDYVPTPIPDYMYDYVSPDGISGATTDTRGPSDGTEGATKKRH